MSVEGAKEAAIDRRYRRLEWVFVLRGALILAIAIADVALLIVAVPQAFEARAVDWEAVSAAAGCLVSGVDPYTGACGPGAAGFVWSPVAAALLVPLSAVGMWGWRLLHLLAVAAMPSLRLRAATLAWWAFWIDAGFGNVMTFALLFAAWALLGRRWAGVAYLALVCLIPKPIFLPIAAWLVWKHRELRPVAGALVVLNAALVLASGYGGSWLTALTQRGAELSNVTNLGPSALVGAWWIPVGMALAAVLWWRGRLGLASLAASPYWLPYYYLMPVLDLLSVPPGVPAIRGPRGRGAGAPGEPGTSGKQLPGEVRSVAKVAGGLVALTAQAGTNPCPYRDRRLPTRARSSWRYRFQRLVARR